MARYLTVQCRGTQAARDALEICLGELSEDGEIQDVAIETLVLTGSEARFRNLYELRFSGAAAPVVNALSALPVVETLYLTLGRNSQRRRGSGGPANSTGGA